MYLWTHGWYGDEALELLEQVETPQEFWETIVQFNKDTFQYKDRLVYTLEVEEMQRYLNFNNRYFDYWFSDRVFFKNMSDDICIFTLRDDEQRNVWVDPGETARFNFWMLAEEDDSKYEKLLIPVK